MGQLMRQDRDVGEDGYDERDCKYYNESES